MIIFLKKIIIIVNVKKKIKYYDEDLDIIFSYQNKRKKIIFYKCKSPPYCSGRDKINKQTKEKVIIEKCDKNINHENISFEKFHNLYKHKKLNEINFDIKKYHRFYVKCLLMEDEYIDIPTTIEKFKKDIKRNILLSNHEISIIKSIYNEKYHKKSNLYNLITSIIEENWKINFDIKSSDIKYIYKNKINNKIIPVEREDKFIFFGTKESINI